MVTPIERVAWISELCATPRTGGQATCVTMISGSWGRSGADPRPIVGKARDTSMERGHPGRPDETAHRGGQDGRAPSGCPCLLAIPEKVVWSCTGDSSGVNRP